MYVKITNICEKSSVRNRFVSARVGHGQSFHISLGNQQIMFDMGLVGRTLVKNMRKLGYTPDNIDKIILSHGHMDHVRGLSYFIKSRGKKDKIPVFAHPNVREPKRAYFHGLVLWNAGFPRLDEEIEESIEFVYSKDSTQITPRIFTTGEIGEEDRITKPNLSNYFYHKVQGKWQHDPVIDEQALVIKTIEGLVILTGCCHPGLVNTCLKAQEIVNDEIVAVIGGIHLNLARKKRVKEVIKELETYIGIPKLYPNHSTGERAIRTMKKELGEEQVVNCVHGTKITFAC